LLALELDADPEKYPSIPDEDDAAPILAPTVELLLVVVVGIGGPAKTYQ
jgi:hypothetical protein